MRSQTQRSLLFSFIGSIASCGLVGAYCLLFGTFGSLEGKILGTTSLIGAASILALGAAVPWERRRWHPVGPVGVIMAAIALLLALIAIWSDAWKNEAFMKTMAIACIVGVAVPHVALLSLARLRSAYDAARHVTVGLIALLTGQISFMIVTGIDDDWLLRAMGIVAIGVVCGTIAVPILHRVSAIRVREDIKTVELMLSLTCPRCRKTQQLPAGRSHCFACGLKFLIEIDEEQCAGCGYPLYGLTSSACPECGQPFVPDSSDQSAPARLAGTSHRVDRKGLPSMR